MKEIELSEIEDYVRPLHCGIRWKIIEYLRDDPKSSDEIFNHLNELREKVAEEMKYCKGECNHVIKKKLKKPTLYYHLRELESVGIILMEEYKPSEQKRAPEKVWNLIMEKLIINLK